LRPERGEIRFFLAVEQFELEEQIDSEVEGT